MKQHREISRRKLFAYTGALIASAAGLGVLDKLAGWTWNVSVEYGVGFVPGDVVYVAGRESHYIVVSVDET